MGESGINIFDVAKYILHSIGGEISTMKLQKLCYYCQAWHLALEGEPLFPQEFEAWANGPVCRELFNAHKGWFGIREEDIPQTSCSRVELPEQATMHVDRVLEDYGCFDGAQLSELTHGESPWKDARRNQIIPLASIKKYYESL
ncbi:MAG: DUF4065 domain-containing protein [Puniceicoccales bacterium]|jgi:uncharacterized phage-associated protein|nr:DUF4065 domain-containing protein [Puniceicoccales bacterium]